MGPGGVTKLGRWSGARETGEGGGGSGTGNQLSLRDEAKRWVWLREARVLGVSAGLLRSPPARDWWLQVS